MRDEPSLLNYLRRGLYVDNLYEMAALCKKLALDVSNPVPFFVMRHIFLDIARQWEGRPVLVEEAQALEAKMLKPLEELVIEVHSAGPRERIEALLERVVFIYLSTIP